MLEFLRTVSRKPCDKIQPAPSLTPCHYDMLNEVAIQYRLIGEDNRRIDNFKPLDDDDKHRVREATIRKLQTECSKSGMAGIIASQYSLWPEKSPTPQRIMTDADTRVYTHIVYLNNIPRDVFREKGGGQKQREQTERDVGDEVSTGHLRKWQEHEMSQLRTICYQAGILLSVISDNLVDSVVARFNAFATSSPDSAIREAPLNRLHNLLPSPLVGVRQVPLETALVFNGARTIAPEDSTRLFWELASETVPNADMDALNTLFGSDLGYSDRAFMQAALLYEDIGDHEIFDRLCAKVASKITLHPEVVAFLEETARDKSIRVFIVTCGLAVIWEKVLAREMLSHRIKVIGTGPTRHGCVVTPTVKRDIVRALKRVWGLKTWVFGSSSTDIPMLREANYPVVVVGSEEMRSVMMERELSQAIESGLQARQVLLPNTVAPLLDTTMLPMVQLKDLGFADSASPRQHTIELPVALPRDLGLAETATSRPDTPESTVAQLSDIELTDSASRQLGEPDIVHATGKAASRLLMTQIWDARVFGPSLREAHHRVGQYLATEFIADRIGTEEYPVPHDNGSQAMGFRLKDEDKALIVSLTRAGEPMASGVSSVFQTAMFLRTDDPFDLPTARIKQASSILLVEGVVNSGTRMLKAIQHIRAVAPEVRVVVVARAVQERCVGRDGGNELSCLIRDDEKLSVVALHVLQDRDMD